MVASRYTYAELAKILGVKPNTVRARAKREGWTTIRPNESGPGAKTLVEIDLDLISSKDTLKNANPENVSKIDLDTSKMIDSLSNQLKVKDNQLARQQETIDSLVSQMSDQKRDADHRIEQLQNKLIDAQKRRKFLGIF